MTHVLISREDAELFDNLVNRLRDSGVVTATNKADFEGVCLRMAEALSHIKEGDT